MSTPISVMMTSAVRRCTPWIVHSSLINCLLERGDLVSARLGEVRDLLIEEVEVGEDRADPDDVEMVEAPLKRLFQRGDLGAQPTLRELGEAIVDTPPGCRASRRRSRLAAGYRGAPG